MTENELDALMFAINKAAMEAQTKAMESEGYLEREYMFNKGQYQAFSQVYTMLTNHKTRQNEL